MSDLEREIRRLAARAASGTGHLDLAVAATAVADLATRVARSEVMAARAAGTTWAEVADAFGIATQTAHERFRSGPDGLHSRFDRRQPQGDRIGSGRTVSTDADAPTGRRPSIRS